MQDLFLQVVIPCLLFISFFLLEVRFRKFEKLITLALICFCVIIFLLHFQNGELILFFVGLVVGLFIEVGLGFIARSQHWENASFFGVPYWLPIIWGIGFVLIHRIGSLIVK